MKEYLVGIVERNELFEKSIKKLRVDTYQIIYKKSS